MVWGSSLIRIGGFLLGLGFRVWGLGFSSLGFRAYRVYRVCKLGLGFL